MPALCANLQALMNHQKKVRLKLSLSNKEFSMTLMCRHYYGLSFSFFLLCFMPGKKHTHTVSLLIFMNMNNTQTKRLDSTNHFMAFWLHTLSGNFHHFVVVILNITRTFRHGIILKFRKRSFNFSLLNFSS